MESGDDEAGAADTGRGGNERLCSSRVVVPLGIKNFLDSSFRTSIHPFASLFDTQFYLSSTHPHSYNPLICLLYLLAFWAFLMPELEQIFLDRPSRLWGVILVICAGYMLLPRHIAAPAILTAIGAATTRLAGFVWGAVSVIVALAVGSRVWNIGVRIPRKSDIAFVIIAHCLPMHAQHSWTLPTIPISSSAHQWCSQWYMRTRPQKPGEWATMVMQSTGFSGFFFLRWALGSFHSNCCVQMLLSVCCHTSYGASWTPDSSEDGMLVSECFNYLYDPFKPCHHRCVP